MGNMTACTKIGEIPSIRISYTDEERNSLDGNLKYLVKFNNNLAIS